VEKEEELFDWWKDEKIYLIGRVTVIIGEIAVMIEECGHSG